MFEQSHRNLDIRVKKDGARWTSACSVSAMLVVDDTPAIRKIVCEIFTGEEDFEVCRQAENGREGVEKAQQCRPALIVMDLYMPLMNGLEATRSLKKLKPAVPVIIFSAHPWRIHGEGS